MTRKKNLTILIVILTLFFIAFQNNLFSIFQPEPSGLEQIVSTNQHVFDGTAAEIAKCHRGGLCSGISQGTSNSPQGTSNVWTYATFTNPNIVTINTGTNIFKFEAEMTGNGVGFDDIVAPSPPVSSLGLPWCWQRIKVFKDDSLFTTFKSWGDSNDPWNTKQFFVGNIYEVSDDNNNIIKLTMSDLGDGGNAGLFFGQCRLFINNYKLEFNENTFNINVSIPQKTVIEGQNISIVVDIENKLNTPVIGKITTNLKINTLFGDVIKEDIQNKVLSPGNNQIIFTMKAVDIETEIKANVKAEIFYKGENLLGLNEYRSIYTVNQCASHCPARSGSTYSIRTNANLPTKILSADDINIGLVIASEQILSISPKPLYLEISNGGCPNGYVPNLDSTLCIRDDVSELTCFILGCPNINGTQYQCTSAGICAETVFISQSCLYDQETFSLLNQTEQQSVEPTQVCPLGTTCDADNGFCIKSELFTEIIQCQTSSDCAIPCDGKTATCNELDRCAYSGECIPQTIGCNDVGCSEGFTCNQNLNVCENIPEDNKLFIYIGIGIVGFLLFFLFKRFGRNIY